MVKLRKILFGKSELRSDFAEGAGHQVRVGSVREEAAHSSSERGN